MGGNYVIGRIIKKQKLAYRFIKSIIVNFVNQNSNIVKEKKLEELLLDEIKNMPIKVNKENTKIFIQEKENLSYEIEIINDSLQKEYEKYKKGVVYKGIFTGKTNILIEEAKVREGIRTGK